MDIPATWSSSWTLELSAPIARRCDALAWSGPYRQYARSPRRVCQALDHVGVSYDRTAVLDRLQAWFIFMAVADDAIDHGSLAAGADLLARMDQPLDTVTEQTPAATLIAELLKRHMDDACRAAVLDDLAVVYRSLVGEREARTFADFLPARRQLGFSCSTMNYALIEPLLGPHPPWLRHFFGEIGDVGTLVDSLFDYPVDRLRGEIQFPLTPAVYLQTLSATATLGTRLALRHPRLIPLFLAASWDNLGDLLRRDTPAQLCHDTD